ncbi:MAG: carboxylating nicotinate-nucleotide diphosphorylase [bacterium]|nr:carboxylating nicotinate-nucleotide diphosphorylase [bacterium]
MIEATFPHHLVQNAIVSSLQEDLGLAGDITGNAVLKADEIISCSITAREAGTVAGMPLALATFKALDPKIKLAKKMSDGDKVKAGDVVLAIKGNSRATLAAERVALNYLCHLSGVASLTQKFVQQTKGTNAAICCTRKTLPGLRAFQKYAVRAGGGRNHRYGLDQAVLIKDNHIASAGGIKQVLERVKKLASHMVRIEIEVDTLAQLETVMNYKVDAVLLDNMKPAQLEKAVALVDGRAITEASGGINLQTVKKIAQTGVDLISVGALTHSAPIFDFGLDYR